MEIDSRMAMGWALTRFSLTKAVPLTISWGTTAAVVRLELRVERDGLVGRGESGGFETGHPAPVAGHSADGPFARSSGWPADH